MTVESKTEREPVTVAVSEDRMTAFIEPTPGSGAAPVSTEDVLAALTSAKVEINDDVKAQVDQFVKLCQAGSVPSTPFGVAKGVKPVEGTDEELVWDPIFEKCAEEWKSDAPVNYFAFNSILAIEKDAVIGTVTPMVRPRDGADVTGNAIKPKREPIKLTVDDTIKVTSDSRQLIALTPGKVVEKNHKVWIEEVVQIEGNLDLHVGNIDAITHVHIHGSVPDRFEARSKESMTIDRTIEAAVVEVEQDLAVKRGIVGRNHGRVRAGGQIVARFCSEADLRAGDDIKVGVQIIHSRVHTAGALVAEHAAVIGGHLFAQRGAKVGSLGSDGYVPTRVFVGPDPSLLKEAEDIKANLKPKRDAVDKIRNAVQPLMDNLKRLTPQQREQATELMFKAEEMAADIANEEERRERMLALDSGPETAAILVAKVIHPKVVMSYGFHVTVFDKELKGPVSVELQKINGVTELVAVNQQTMSTTILPSTKISAKDLLADFAPLIPPATSESAG